MQAAPCRDGMREVARVMPSKVRQRHVHAAEGWAAEAFPQNGHERREDPFAEVDTAPQELVRGQLPRAGAASDGCEP